MTILLKNYKLIMHKKRPSRNFFKKTTALITVFCFLMQNTVLADPSDFQFDKRTETLQVPYRVFGTEGDAGLVASLLAGFLKKEQLKGEAMTVPRLAEAMKVCDSWAEDHLESSIYSWQIDPSKTELVIHVRDPDLRIRYFNPRFMEPDPSMPTEEKLSRYLSRQVVSRTGTAGSPEEKKGPTDLSTMRSGESTDKKEEMPPGGNAAGRAFDAYKNLWAGVSGSLFLPVAAYLLKDIHSPPLLFITAAYLVTAVFLPLAVSFFVKRSLAISNDASVRTYRLIRPFEKAKDIRHIEDVEDDARDKISYFSFSLLNRLKKETGKRNIYEAMFIEKEAMKRMPRIMQYVVFFHEYLHARAHNKIEAINIPLTFSLPWMVASGAPLLVFGSVLSPSAYLFVSALFYYNLFVPFIAGLFAYFFGFKVSIAGHYLVDISRHSPLTETEVDVILSEYAHRTTATESGERLYWRHWMKGSSGEESVELVEVRERPEDIIVVKSNAQVEELPSQIKKCISLSEKKRFVLIIADSDFDDDITFPERERRIRHFSDLARKAFFAAKEEKGRFLVKPRLTKIDIRSTKYNIGRLKDLYGFYKKRLVRLQKGELEKEAVAPEVSGEVERLKKVLTYLPKFGYEKIIFTGDYLGKDNALDALFVLMEHSAKKVSPEVEMVMGRAEHLFLRAMMQDKSPMPRDGPPLYEQWPDMATLEGPAVMAALDEMAENNERLVKEKKPLSPLQKEVQKFELCLSKLAEKRGAYERGYEEQKKSLRREYYFYHPALIRIADFMVHNMRFVYYEDEHRNLYLSQGLPAGFHRHGLWGVSGLIRMEQEFYKTARRNLAWLKNKSSRWRNGILLSFEDLKEKEYLEKLMRIEHGIPETSEDLAPIFRASFEDFMGTPFQPGTHGLQAKSTQERQQREQMMGINTLFSVNDFSGGSVQDLGEVRLLNERGDIFLVDVDTLEKGPRAWEQVTVVNAFQKEAEERAPREFQKRTEELLEERKRSLSDAQSEGERNKLEKQFERKFKKNVDDYYRAVESSLEYITLRKLKGLPLGAPEKELRGVESIIEEYENLLDNVKMPPLRSVNQVLRKLFRSGKFLGIIAAAFGLGYWSEAFFEPAYQVLFALTGSVLMTREESLSELIDGVVKLERGRFMPKVPMGELQKPASRSSREDASGKSLSVGAVEAEADKEVTGILESSSAAVKGLVHYLGAWTDIDKDRKYVLALALPEGSGQKRLQTVLRRRIADSLRNLHHYNEDIAMLIGNLSIISSESDVLARRIENMLNSGEVRPENIIVVSPENKLADFAPDPERGYYLTAYDDSEFSAEKGRLDYYPVLEIAFFAVLSAFAGKMAGMGATRREMDHYKKTLYEFYRKIPNVQDLGIDEFLENCFEKNFPRRTVILKLVPRARKFTGDEMKEMYSIIQEFITKA